MSSEKAKVRAERSEARETYELLAIAAWVAVAILAINVSYFVGAEVGGETFQSGLDFLPILQAFTIGVLKASPTILIAVALVDFSFFFHRCGEGAVFTERNVATLKGGADSLIMAAVLSALVKPFILGIIGDPDGGKILDFTDLALGVGLMGIALHGFGTVLKDAVALKDDNDQII